MILLSRRQPSYYIKIKLKSIHTQSSQPTLVQSTDDWGRHQEGDETQTTASLTPQDF